MLATPSDMPLHIREPRLKGIKPHERIGQLAPQFLQLRRPKRLHHQDTATRRQRSKASLQALSARYGINPKTVAKWRRRTSLEDRPMGPKVPRSTVLSTAEETLIVAFRRHTLLPLDDCLYASTSRTTMCWIAEPGKNSTRRTGLAISSVTSLTENGLNAAFASVLPTEPRMSASTAHLGTPRIPGGCSMQAAL